MDRKLFGIFSGRQLTAIAIAAILAPSALFAAVTYTAVGIIDPNSGSKSYVDPSRKLWVYDPVNGYANTPGSKVNMFGVATTSCSNLYTIPAGKAFVVTGITTYVFPSSSGTQGNIIVYAGSAPGACDLQVIGAGAVSVAGSVSPNLGTGVVVPAGQSISVESNSATGSLNVVGYLIPATALPSSASADAVANYVGPRRPVSLSGR